MRRFVHLFRRSDRGTSAIEFALVVPVLLLFVAGIVELGRAFQVYNSVNRLATRYAISWADCVDLPSGYCGYSQASTVVDELNYYSASAAIQNMAPQLNYSSTNPVLRMFEVQMSSGNAATVVYVYPVGATLAPGELSAAQTLVGAGNTGVVVTVSYVHTLLFFANVMKPFFPQGGGTASWTVNYTIAQRKNVSSGGT